MIENESRKLGSAGPTVFPLARLDPKVPIEDTVGAISELVKAGYVRCIGLSEVGPETIRRAHAVHPICGTRYDERQMKMLDSERGTGSSR